MKTDVTLTHFWTKTSY